MNEFKLNKEEIAREIHHLLREEYPDKNIDGTTIADFIGNLSAVKSGLAFNVRGYCEKTGMNPEQTAKQILFGLEIELEKNLHDKILFSIALKGNNIEFYNENMDK